MQMMQFVLTASLMCGIGSEGNLDWQSHYGEAKQAAHDSQRPMLVVLENPAHEDTAFDENALAEQDKQVELMRKYLLCRVDVSTPYGKRVAAAFRANEFPYTVITDKTATFITFRKSGKMSSEQWCANLETHKNGMTQVVSAEPRVNVPATEVNSAPVRLPYYQSPGNFLSCTLNH